jgi:hypothetical protein
MITGQIEQLSGVTLFVAKARACWELLKFRLSFLVAFSCAFGYSLASDTLIDGFCRWPFNVRSFYCC